MWLEPEELSKWAYNYCKTIEDRPEIRKYINDSKWSFWYCKDVKDRPKIRKYIFCAISS